ncbi:nucleoside 2-deoxyribosyltransferase [Mycolicibacterium holsaticum]|uniref:nucleoside 2-deoxyribosyltransferase n=1 Tax=Mycolicibacterium holsaticum TaxID=152142 RepID=UPI001C7D7E08|nr:nucleoside 2-deoxyribosyltransferase [Mycolicibacterium holsaticum]QZA13631.1 nucleoside 2-deoxyribosyltransferase [Mycolicibacterium holsaticum DSM 44478 = JCM 12374]UNC08906.1 hypothetical protein H5U41_21220 [Mycolicibacterium holsaticum DSM 44478 = JCM 12374]
MGYPEKPRGQADVLRATAKKLNSAGVVAALTWESLNVEGTIVISAILEAIDSAAMCVFDITAPNPNVLFEAGYAIGRGKPVWLTMDATDARAQSDWRDFALLREVGYTAYQNSDELVGKFDSLDPISNLQALYDQIIEPALPEQETPRDSVLYCTTFQPFEASNRLNNMMEARQSRGEKIIVADPSETSLVPLTWFVRQMSAAAGVIVSYAGQNRKRADLYNNRHAFIAGVAMGLEIPILMLAEDTYAPPFDYEGLLHIYETAEECLEDAREWLGSLELDRASWKTPRVSLRSKLAGLRFGEHVAENERTELPDYFVETSGYHEVVAARDSIFIGHRGTGKTANAIQAFDHLAGNKTNLVILIKPPGFEFPAMLAVIERLPAFQHDYFFDALWRFVIQTEIANAVLQRLEQRSQYVPYSADEQSFLDYVQEAPFVVRAEMSVRLEQALDALLSALPEQSDDSKRNLINEAFHTRALAVLRSRLGIALKDRSRVAVFVDNLDKGWERSANFSVMARFILGLLTARGQIVLDFQREDYWRESIKLTVAIFLRSDIYAYLRDAAREPDKLPISNVTWRDRATLRHVLESRFLLSTSSPSPDRLWSEVFCDSVDGEATADYILRVILPRPRDLVFISNAAVAHAVDRGHDRVESEDFLSAKATYSQYAYEALLVENGVTIPQMEDVLLSFIGAPSIGTYADRTEMIIRYGGFTTEQVPPLISKLISMSFFGVEIAPEEFVFPEIGTEMKLATTKAARLQSEEAERKLMIHPAFEAFLGVEQI